MIKKYKYFTKKQANRILWKIYKRIKDKEVVVRFDSSIAKTKPKLDAWLSVTEKGTMIIIHPDSSIIGSFVHEYLHIIYCDAEEKEILRKEKELISLWSDRQLENLLSKLTKLIRVRPMKIKNYDEWSYNSSMDKKTLKKQQ